MLTISTKSTISDILWNLNVPMYDTDLHDLRLQKMLFKMVDPSSSYAF